MRKLFDLALRRLALLPALTLLLLLSFPAAAEGLAAYAAKSNGCPYYIMVNRSANTVTVYRQDGDGYYTVPARAMVCSVGRAGSETPLGTYAITGVKQAWCYMLDGSYGQYSSQFSGHFLFHSVCYTRADPSALMTEEYNLLGEAASLGCVRLQVADAKWIYDNCAKGTLVTIYDDSGDPGPLGKPEPAVAEITPEQDNGWEPTDPRPENPWRLPAVTALALSEDTLTLEAGEAAELSAVFTPADAAAALVWSSSNPAVAQADETGRVVALSAGSTVVTAEAGGFQAGCKVRVTGALLPFSDLEPGAWYYGDVRSAVSLGRLNGRGDGTFAPDAQITWAEALQLLYNLAGRPGTASGGEDTPARAGETSQQGDAAWYAAALAWAADAGVLGDYARSFNAGRSISRQDFSVLLRRYTCGASGQDGLSAASDSGDPEAALSPFRDVSGLGAETRTALGWMVQRGLLRGTGDGLLRPNDTLTRAQAAAILRRWG